MPVAWGLGMGRGDSGGRMEGGWGRCQMISTSFVILSTLQFQLAAPKAVPSAPNSHTGTPQNVINQLVCTYNFNAIAISNVFLDSETAHVMMICAPSSAFNHGSANSLNAAPKFSSHSAPALYSMSRPFLINTFPRSHNSKCSKNPQ